MEFKEALLDFSVFRKSGKFCGVQGFITEPKSCIINGETTLVVEFSFCNCSPSFFSFSQKRKVGLNDDMDATLRVLKAVANSRRLAMIKLLGKKGRLTLREISDIMDIPEATACRNLKILENAGVVKSTIYRALAEYWLDRDMTKLPNRAVVDIILHGEL